ncbi:MAG: hypothetical protein ACRDQ0_07410, partial [Pseudonocardia sp.]
MATPAPDLERLRTQVQQLVRTGDTAQLKTVRDQVKSARDRKEVKQRTARYGLDPVRWVRERLRQV